MPWISDASNAVLQRVDHATMLASKEITCLWTIVATLSCLFCAEHVLVLVEVLDEQHKVYSEYVYIVATLYYSSTYKYAVFVLSISV